MSRIVGKGFKLPIKKMHLLSNILVSKEKSYAEVFGGDILTIPYDELADASEHDIFDSLCCDPAQVRYEDRSISHPAIYRPSQRHCLTSYGDNKSASRSCGVQGRRTSAELPIPTNGSGGRTGLPHLE